LIAPELVVTDVPPNKKTPSRFGVFPAWERPVISIVPLFALTAEPFISIASSATGPAAKLMLPFVELTTGEVMLSFPLPLKLMFPEARRLPEGVIAVPPEILIVPAEAVSEPDP
jgi:hypothetical protein